MFDTKRLLVISGTAPGDNGVGALLLKQILEGAPRQSIHVVALIPPRERRPDGAWTDTIVDRRFEAAYRPLSGGVGSAFSVVAFFLKLKPHLNRAIRTCVAAGLRHESEALLVILNCPSSILIAKQVARVLGIPIYSFVMDTPESLVSQLGYGAILRAKLLKTFDSLIQSTHRLAVAGETMQKEYLSRYGKNGVVLRQGNPVHQLVPGPLIHDGNEGALEEKEEIVIGFAGSLSGADAFNELLQELDRRRWIVGGREVVLRFVGAILKLTPSGPQRVEYFGWRTHKELVALLKQCSFLYLPQPFDNHEIARFSFPNKLCSYVAVGRPILLHAPDYSSITEFYRRFPCGPHSASLNASELIEKMLDCIERPAQYAEYCNEAHRAFVEELNDRVLCDRASQFLGKRD